MASTLADYITALGDESGTITKVVSQAKRHDRVSIFIDGEFAFGVSDEVAAHNGLRAGVIVASEILHAVAREEEMTNCKRVALHYISYRMRSEVEVRRRLAKEDAGPAIVDAVLAQLRQIGVVDDKAFASAFGRDAVLGRKWGPHRVARGLRQAGVSDEYIEEALGEVRNTLEDEDVVMKVGRKRWEQLQGVSDVRKRKKRLYDYLARRGFDFADIRRVLDDLAALK